MKIKPSLNRFCVFTALIWCLVGYAGATPERPVGWVYYESGRTIARTAFSMSAILKENGVFEGLYFISTGPGSTDPAFVLNPEDGTWTYRKIDDATAELVLRTSSGSGPVSATRILQFSSDSSGTAVRTDFGSGGSSGGAFRLSPQASQRPLLNCSNRSYIRTGGTAFTGFVIADGTPRAVLIRAIGPGLGSFGVTDFLKGPQLSIRSAKDSSVIGGSTGWTDNLGKPTDGSIAVRRTSTITGAFSLGEGSKDAATILVLGAGAYIAEVRSSEPADSGEVLIEVYLLP